MAVATAEPVLTVDVQRCSDKTTVWVHCHGKLVAGSTGVLSDCVHRLLSDSKRIILDLSDVKHTDSMGLGTLVRLYVSAKSAGVSLELTHLSQQIRNLLGLTNLLDVLTVIGERGIKM
jgi:anti-anti-sigma factor